MVTKGLENVSGKKIEEKDKQGLKEHIETAIGEPGKHAMKKVKEVAAGINNVVNSPEANIAGTVIGGKFEEKLKDVQGAVKTVSEVTQSYSLPQGQMSAADQERLAHQFKPMQ